YDINALWNEKKIENLKIIVINNGGGGIFRIISGPNTIEEMSPYFETTMKSDVKDIAKQYQWNYFTAKDESSLQEALTAFFQRDTSKAILEIFTQKEENPRILKEYWRFLSEKTTEI